jgi:hypothetical protein
MVADNYPWVDRLERRERRKVCPPGKLCGPPATLHPAGPPAMRMKITSVLAVCLCLSPAILRAEVLELAPLGGQAEVVVEEPACTAPGDGQRIFGDVEYVLWWLREARVPPALTTSSFAAQGLLGQGDTRVLYGDDRLETRHGDRFNGTRLTLGWWFDPEQTIGVEGRAVLLERDSTDFKATSDGSQLLALPFIDAVTGKPMSTIVAGPGTGGLHSGGFVGYSRVELFTQEVNALFSLVATPDFHLDLIAGTRFVQMRDRTDLTASGKLLPVGATIFGLTDHYRTHDFFYGGQLGVRGEYDWGRWFANCRAEVAVGGNDEQVNSFGDQLVATPLSRVDTANGVLTLPSNAGPASRTVLNAFYEADLNVGYRLTDHCKVFAGYSLLLWDSPIRSGDQVDLVVNSTQLRGTLVGPLRPTIPFKEDFFWAQGINVGVEFGW